MPGPQDASTGRPCARCGSELPADRSVCPSCGTLASNRVVPVFDPEGFADHELPGAAARVAPRTIGPRPAEQPGPSWASTPTPPHRPIGRPSAAPVVTAPPRPAEPGGRRRRSPWVAGAVVALVLAALAGAVAAAVHFDDEQGPAVGDDPVAAIEGFCDHPRPLAEAGVPAYQPGGAGVAYIPLPRPSSSTRPAEAVTVQVAPEVGDPTLDLDASVALVSVGVCVDQTGSEQTGGTCDYEVTTEGSLGNEVTVDLEQAAYEIRAYDLAGGEVLASGSLDSPVDRCPDQAFVDGDSVANVLSTEDVLAWVAFNLPR